MKLFTCRLLGNLLHQYLAITIQSSWVYCIAPSRVDCTRFGPSARSQLESILAKCLQYLIQPASAAQPLFDDPKLACALLGAPNDNPDLSWFILEEDAGRYRDRLVVQQGLVVADRLIMRPLTPTFSQN